MFMTKDVKPLSEYQHFDLLNWLKNLKILPKALNFLFVPFPFKFNKKSSMNFISINEMLY